MRKALVYQLLMGTCRHLLGAGGVNSPFSLARDPGRARKIILVPEGGLDSLVLARSFLRGWRVRYPSAEISVVTPTEYGSILEGDYWADRLFFYDDRSKNPFSRSLRDLVQRLRSESFDIAVDLSYGRNLETYLPVSLSGASITVGFYDPSGIFTYSISVKGAERHRSYLPRMWSLFKVLDVHPEEDLFHLPGREANVDTVWKTVGISIEPRKEQLIGVFLDDTVEGVFPGREGLSNLLKVLNTLPSEKMLLAQNRLSQRILGDLPRYRVLILPRETIAKIASILKECHLVLTNNIGFALLMASIGGNVIAIVRRLDVERLSLNRIRGIRPFVVDERGLPIMALNDFLRAAVKSGRAD